MSGFIKKMSIGLLSVSIKISFDEPLAWPLTETSLGDLDNIQKIIIIIIALFTRFR